MYAYAGLELVEAAEKLTLSTNTRILMKKKKKSCWCYLKENEKRCTNEKTHAYG